MPAEPTRDDISARLLAMKARSGLSYPEIGRRAGMTHQAAWATITGKEVNPTVRTLRRLVEAMDGTVEEVFAKAAPAAVK